MQIGFAAPQPIGEGALVVGVYEGGELAPMAQNADAAVSGALKRAVEVGRFKGKSGDLLDVIAPAGVAASRIVLAGLGKAKDYGAAAAEKLAAKVLGKLLTSGERSIAFAIDPPKRVKTNDAELAAHLAFGAFLRSYRFDAYRKVAEDDVPTVKSIVIQTREAKKARALWDDLLAAGEGVFLARDLVNEPPNVLYPEEFAGRMQALKKLGVKVEVFDVPAMKKLGMNTLLGVGQGSARDSRMVVLHWNGARKKTKADPPLVFVGKGVCFDSGGLSLKTGQGMVGMKGDMGGGAAVAGLIHALAKRKARVDAIGLVGLVENMPDGNAQRPNDIVKTLSGQTIEILNTDAEGRLVLADVLWYAQSRFKPRFMINLATLTGAIVTALGHEHAGLFSNDDELSSRLSKAGRMEGETVWRMPLGEGYEKLIKSKIADMKNIGGPAGGSITAAQILQRFVNKVPWAHLDIAGVAWQDNEQKPLIPSWGTGWGVRILNRLVAEYYEK
jgi:leucyl aminopeptidase